MTAWLHIVGIGEDGVGALPAAAQNLIANAEVLVGGNRHLAMIAKDHSAERHSWESPLRQDSGTAGNDAGQKSRRAGDRRPDELRHRRDPDA